VPLPAVALAVIKLLQDPLVAMLAEGSAFIATANEDDVKEHPLLLVIVTVYDPAAVAR